MNRQLGILTLNVLALSLIGCGGGGGGDAGNGDNNPPAQVKYSIGGSTSGLRDGQSLTLQLGSQELTVNANNGFSFVETVNSGSNYQVVVKNQPQYQTCQLSNHQGVASAAVNDIQISCVNNEVSLGGTIQGAGLNSGLILIEENSGQSLSPRQDGTYQFTQDVVAGYHYNTIVSKMPDGKFCQIENANGVAEAKVSNVTVNCTALSLLPSKIPPLRLLEKQPTPEDLVTLGTDQITFPDEVERVQIYLNNKAYPMTLRQGFESSFGEAMNDIFEQLDKRTIEELTTIGELKKSANITTSASLTPITVNTTINLNTSIVDRLPITVISKTPRPIIQLQKDLSTTQFQTINSKFSSLKTVQSIPLENSKLQSGASVDYRLSVVGLNKAGEPVSTTTYTMSNTTTAKWINISAERLSDLVRIEIPEWFSARLGCYENGYYRSFKDNSGKALIGCPSITLSSVAPTSLLVGESKQFILKGSHIPQYAYAELEGGTCNLPVQVNATGTEAKVTCTAETKLGETQKLSLYRAIDNKNRGAKTWGINVTEPTAPEPEPQPTPVLPTTKVLETNRAIAGWDRNIPTAQKRPVVVFTPGWGGTSNVNASQSALNKEFVNKGYVTLAIGFDRVSNWVSNINVKTTEGLQKLCADQTIPANCQAIILIGSSYGAGQNLTNAIYQSDNFPSGKILGFISQSAGYNPGWWMADNAHNNALKIADGSGATNRYLADTSKYSVGLISNVGDEVFPIYSFTADGSNFGAGYLAERHKAKGHNRVYSWCPSYGGHSATGNDGKWNAWVFATAKKIIHTDGSVVDNTGSTIAAGTTVTNACPRN